MGEERRRSWAWKTETRQLLVSSAGMNRAIWSWLGPFKPEVSELCGRVCGYPHPGGEYGGGLVNSPLRRSWSPSFCLGGIRHPFGEQVPWWSGQAAPGDDQLKKKVSAMQSVFFPLSLWKNKQLLLVHSSRQGIPYLGNPELHLCHFFCLSREGEVGDSVGGVPCSALFRNRVEFFSLPRQQMWLCL